MNAWLQDPRLCSPLRPSPLLGVELYSVSWLRAAYDETDRIAPIDGTFHGTSLGFTRGAIFDLCVRGA